MPVPLQKFLVFRNNTGSCFRKDVEVRVFSSTPVISWVLGMFKMAKNQAVFCVNEE